MYICAAIKTASRYAARRRAVEETWLPSLKWDSLFLTGGPDIPDGKTMGPKIDDACQWALGRGAAFMFVCDDDTYVRTDRLHDAVPVGLDYVGFERRNCDTPYMQGAGFWLSAVAMHHVVQGGVLRQYGCDDVLLGQALYGKVPYTHDARYQPGPIPIPADDSNDFITAHKCLPHAVSYLPVSMYRMHEICAS